ncbi:MAG: DUF2059 domain-containing protein [Candidatus Kapabacteria bacterium]|nr:DUF2059 domain-containing protein [Candidatus Kapabacteria bacterium]
MFYKIILNFVCIFLLALSLNAQDSKLNTKDSAKQKDILKLLYLVRAYDVPESIVDNIINSYKTMLPAVDSSYWKSLRKEADIEGVIKKIVPVYDRIFNDKEIKELIKFFETPTGKKWVSTFGEANDEVIKIFEEWSGEAFKKLNNKMIKDGYVNQPTKIDE